MLKIGSSFSSSTFCAEDGVMKRNFFLTWLALPLVLDSVYCLLYRGGATAVRLTNTQLTEASSFSYLQNPHSLHICYGRNSKPFAIFCNMIVYSGEELAHRSTSKLEDHPLSAVCDCSFSKYPAILHIYRHPQPDVAPLCDFPGPASDNSP
jgi:hypothetical protein